MFWVLRQKWNFFDLIFLSENFENSANFSLNFHFFFFIESYKQSDLQEREETGSVAIDPETGNYTLDSVVGSYEYIRPDGKKQRVEYTADKEGFRPNVIVTDQWAEQRAPFLIYCTQKHTHTHTQNYLGEAWRLLTVTFSFFSFPQIFGFARKKKKERKKKSWVRATFGEEEDFSKGKRKFNERLACERNAEDRVEGWDFESRVNFFLLFGWRWTKIFWKL